MKKYWALYKKELKGIYGLAVIMILLSVAAYSYDFLAHILRYLELSIPVVNYSLSWQHFGDKYLILSVYMFPVILAYSLNSENISKTHYLGYSLPISKHIVMLCKLLAVISVSFFPIVVMNFTEIAKEIVYKYFATKEISINPSLAQSFYIPTLREVIFRIYWRYIIPYFMQIFVYCGIVCVAQGVMETVKKNRTIVWISAFITSLSIFFFFFERVTGAPTYLMLWFIYSESIVYYWMSAGTIFLLSGLFLYDKYAEV